MNCVQGKGTVAVPFNPAFHGESNAAANSVMLATPDSVLAQRLTRELKKAIEGCEIASAPSLSAFRERLKTSAATLIFLDSDLLGGLSLVDLVRQAASAAPVLVLGSLNSQVDMARLVAEGRVDFVARVGDFVPLLLAMLVRQSRQSCDSQFVLSSPPMPSDIAEIFRHEINNPLTGILGNAELVLAHPEHFSGLEVQRLRTVVELAVRLRESIRRISNAWERPAPPEKPA